MEIWKDIEGYGGQYQISSVGEAKGLERKTKHWQGGLLTVNERVLKPMLVGKDYRQYYLVGLYKNGKRKMVPIHRLVALHFVPNPGNLPCVNHIDNNPLNNHYTNLEWCTVRENKNHGMTFKKTSSDYPGVCWDKRRKKWLSNIRINGKHKYLGYFINELEAASAYQNALKQLVS